MPASTAISPAHSDYQTVIKTVADWDNSTLEIFADQVNRMIAERNTQLYLSKHEEELIKKIKKGLPGKDLKRYRLLARKLESEMGLTHAEQQEFKELIDTADEFAVERLSNMIELSKRLNVSVDEVMKRLEIKPPADV